MKHDQTGANHSPYLNPLKPVLPFYTACLHLPKRFRNFDMFCGRHDQASAALFPYLILVNLIAHLLRALLHQVDLALERRVQQ